MSSRSVTSAGLYVPSARHKRSPADCAAGFSPPRSRHRTHRVERLSELPGPVPDQKPEPGGALPQVGLTVLALSGRRRRGGRCPPPRSLTADPGPGHLAVVTETCTAYGITESTEHIWTALARRHGPSLILLEHHPAPPGTEGRGRRGDSRRRCRRLPPVDARVADSGGESPPCRARAADGRLRVPDRQQAGQRVRPVPG